MRYLQFRVHPSVGAARMGASTKAYYLASEFPWFMQEEFPALRLSPKPRRHPMAFFNGDATAFRAKGNLVDYSSIYDVRPEIQGKFKESVGKIFPQAARFRVFAYVFSSDEDPHPHKVFEVTSEIADIEWRVNLANKKSRITRPFEEDPAPNMREESWTLDTSVDSLVCKRILPRVSLPNLGYIFLEPDDTDRSKVTGRLHVIGNEGDIVGNFDDDPVDSLWNDNWFDAAADGSVEAYIKPKQGGALLRAKAGAESQTELEYLGYKFEPPRAGPPSSIAALPGWVVVGCPDYVPDTPHFVSLWDTALGRGINNLDNRRVTLQPGKHNLIVFKSKIDSYLRMDYLIHIHPQLCLFEDVRSLSGEAFGDSEATEPRGHNKFSGPLFVPPPGATDETTRSKRIEHGGFQMKPRLMKADLADPSKMKDPDPRKPISAWMKIAVFQRLRKPGTLYDKKRNMFLNPPGPVESSYVEGTNPRKLGRRMDYDREPGPGSDKGLFFDAYEYAYPKGNLRKFHGLAFKGKLCGGEKSPPRSGPLGSQLSFEELDLMALLDDMYWPASFSDMPMLRELAYTHLQYDQFGMWQAAEFVPLSGSMTEHSVRTGNIFDEMVSPALKTSFQSPHDSDKHFSDFLAARPAFAPAIIDMAHLGSMLGGSLYPGIEVGREGGIASNWCLFHGGTIHFPDVRFKHCHRESEHTVGTLTKDLAVPWTKDFAACDETFWPTARPGIVNMNQTEREYWINREINDSDDPDEAYEGDVIPHLGHAAKDGEYLKEYWKSLRFIRREGDILVEKE